VPGLGISANGAQRWLQVGGFQLQPSELAKIAAILYIVRRLATVPPPVSARNDLFLNWRAMVPFIVAGAILVQRDLGSATILGATALGLSLLCGTRWLVLLKVLGPFLAAFAFSIIVEPFRRERFMAFIDPWADPHGSGFQLAQGL